DLQGGAGKRLHGAGVGDPVGCALHGKRAAARGNGFLVHDVDRALPQRPLPADGVVHIHQGGAGAVDRRVRAVEGDGAGAGQRLRAAARDPNMRTLVQRDLPAVDDVRAEETEGRGGHVGVADAQAVTDIEGKAVAIARGVDGEARDQAIAVVNQAGLARERGPAERPLAAIGPHAWAAEPDVLRMHWQAGNHEQKKENGAQGKGDGGTHGGLLARWIERTKSGKKHHCWAIPDRGVWVRTRASQRTLSPHVDSVKRVDSLWKNEKAKVSYLTNGVDRGLVPRRDPAFATI